MRIALAQINTTVGDLAGNVAKCLEAIASAEADLVVLPEMAIPGYPPRDILFDSSFAPAAYTATQDLAKRAKGLPPAIVGTLSPAGNPIPNHPNLHNSAVLIHNGTAQVVATKQLLPAYDVFFEPRWFRPGTYHPPITIAGKKVGVLICEDLWDEGYGFRPGQELIADGAELLICLSASPYRQGVLAKRHYHAQRQGCPVVYVNLVGATDELIFDGRSFVIDPAGNPIHQAPAFTKSTTVVDTSHTPHPTPHTPHSTPQNLYNALTLGIRDFAHKNRLQHAFLGLSGGIDSALTAVLASHALGAKNVTALAMPSRYSDPRSTKTAQELANSLGLGFQIVPIEPLHTAAEATLGDLLADGGTTAENVQARLRTVILMAYVNKQRGFLLNTSNKTELSFGYSTIYGDMSGTLCPIADLTKPQVYELARWINRAEPLIPPFILDRAPSAELKPDQVDPFDYDVVSPQMEAFVQANQSNPPLLNSEHKRWQMGVVLKVSEKAFGSGRVMPITRR